eukprot:symbB.v1.2.005744.t1/scaffold307.1/size232847/9
MHNLSNRDAKRLAAHKQTRLCKFFAVGACTKGSSCPFAHGTSHLREQPDFSKTRLCTDFMERGHCAKGDSCKFAHGKRDLRPGSYRVGSKGNMQTSQEVKKEAHANNATWGHHSGYEQAALKLILKSSTGQGRSHDNTCAEWTEKADCCELNTCTSLSRQTTCEGVETSSFQFSRCCSSNSDGSTDAFRDAEGAAATAATEIAGPATTKKIHWQVRVRNTFIEIQDDTIQEGCPIRKCHSMPSLL